MNDLVNPCCHEKIHYSVLFASLGLYRADHDPAIVHFHTAACCHSRPTAISLDHTIR